MKVWSAIYNFIAIFLLIILIPSYYTYQKSLDKEFDQMRLDAAVDNATKAMMYASTSVDNIELDYINEDAIVLSPGKSIDMFDTVMCFSYDMDPTEANKNAIETSVCAMVLSDEYGFYIAQLVEDDLTPNNSVKGKDYVLRWSTRTPYGYTDADGNYNTFSYSYYPLLTMSAGGTATLKKIAIDKDDDTVNRQIIQYINEEISKSIEAEIDRRNKSNSFDFKFYLPTETTALGVNPIKSPSCLVFLNNASYASNYKIDAVNVGGYKAVSRTYILCFTYGGQQWYCYSSQVPPEMLNNIRVDDKVSTMKEAVDKGYAPYLPWMMNQKNK